MQRPYEIYRKHQYLVKKEMGAEVQKLLCKSFKNCKHNCPISLDDGRAARVCSFGQRNGDPLDPVKIITCDSDACAFQCPAYTPTFLSAEEARDSIINELANPDKKAERFPAICALEWVMGNTLHDISRNPPTLIIRAIFSVIARLERLAIALHPNKGKVSWETTNTSKQNVNS